MKSSLKSMLLGRRVPQPPALYPIAMPGEPLRGRTEAQLIAENKQQCSCCGMCFAVHGFERHRKTCERDAEDRQKARGATKRLRTPEPSAVEPETKKRAPNRSRNNLSWHLSASSTRFAGNEGSTSVSTDTQGLEDSINEAVQAAHQSETAEPEDGTLGSQSESRQNASLEEGSIRFTNTYRPRRCYTTEDIISPERHKSNASPLFSTGAPWEPFRTHEDLRFARVTLNTPASEVEEHIRLHRLATNSPVTFKNQKELRTFENRAAQLLTDFEPVPFTTPYKRPNEAEQMLEFQAWFKPPMEWLLELLRDEVIQEMLQFDAVQMHRWSNGAWTRFVNEPWTTPGWEEAQALLPDDGLPLMLEIYADKSAVSSFGGKKVYPVVARLLNLPREIRNGKGVGGGQIIALLPVVEGDQSESGQTYFADLKCAVWHKAMKAVLESIRSASRLGHAVELTLSEQLGLDGRRWRVFPVVLVVSADYEEQIIMASHRGLKSLKPCVRCDIPKDELHDLEYKFKLRDPTEAADLIKQAAAMAPTRAEKFLRSHSLRPVNNAFFMLGKRTNLYKALSYDTLHNDDLGRWGKHLWPLLKQRVADSGAQAIADFNSRIDAIPRWSDLNHYSKALNIDYTDGRKYEDLLKIVLHGALALDESLLALIKLIRIQAELRILESLEVQTTETIALGREVIKQFDTASKECTKSLGKGFNFPKMHLLVHLFDDIWEKGVTPNYSTKPSESLHRTLKKAYEVSSKKNETVDAEVLRKTHLRAVYELLQEQIELAEKSTKPLETDFDEEEGNQTVHIALGSKPRRFQSLVLIEDAFQRSMFHLNLDKQVRECLYELGFEADSASAEIEARECHMLRVQYESMVDWCLHRDILHCSPSFHSCERQDCVLVDSDEGVSIARLLMLLECRLTGPPATIISLALISYLDPVDSPTSPIERAMGFRRFRERHQSRADVIPARSIIRGALLVTVLDPKHLDDYLANDLFDPDMYFRFRTYTANNQFCS
ncbi:hypothetical protein FRC12_001518 [Ceratobasidium sp. 428]|nr:hypothetical protein FRC12_001518 [Ceratobasidium sp. 428]